MSAYVIANVKIEDQARYDRYRGKVAATVAAYGGRFLVRGGAIEPIEGTWRPARLVVLEFADMATAKRWYHSPEYQGIVGDRIAATESHLVFVEGAA